MIRIFVHKIDLCLKNREEGYIECTRKRPFSEQSEKIIKTLWVLVAPLLKMQNQQDQRLAGFCFSKGDEIIDGI